MLAVEALINISLRPKVILSGLQLEPRLQLNKGFM
jgi:hypothetical protein